MKKWFVWEHRDHSGLEIGPLLENHETIYGGVLKGHVDAKLFVSGRGGYDGRHLTDEQRTFAQIVCDAWNAHQERT